MLWLGHAGQEAVGLGNRLAAVNDFFVASAGVAGALIGLLFVAISVAGDRLKQGPDSYIHRVRASAALTGFTNALVVSLIALDPIVHLGAATVAVAIVGMLFVAASLLLFLRIGGLHRHTLRDASYVTGLLIVFVLQLVAGFRIGGHPTASQLSEIAILVVVSFLIGIARSWELIGGPSIGLTGELKALWRTRDPRDDDPPR